MKMARSYFLFTFYLILIVAFSHTADGQSSSCSCTLDNTGMTMICMNVQSIAAYQKCMHDQLNTQSDSRLRRGGVMTNLTIVHHQLRSASSGLLQFSYGNNVYQLTDLRYLSITDGTLRYIENQALSLIDRALEHLDLSYNELQQIPTSEKEQFGNLV